MSLQDYSKDYSSFLALEKKSETRRKRDRYFALGISLVGILSIVFAAWPFFVWQVSTSKKLASKAQTAPVPQQQIITKNPLLSADIQVVKDEDGFTYFTTNYTPKDQTVYLGKKPKEFYLTVPKLDIEKAIVKVDTLTFQNNLSHFPGTALPGEIGNSFITGHSALPQLANPKDYHTIFSKLPTLEVGDEVYVDISGKTLKYVVQYSKIVDPKDTSVLAPISAKGRNLTLMTCVPPGLSTKRLIVIGSLI